MQQNRAELTAMLVEQGISEDYAKTMSEVITDDMAGAELTESRASLLRAMESDTRVQAAVQAVFGTADSAANQRTQRLQGLRTATTAGAAVDADNGLMKVSAPTVGADVNAGGVSFKIKRTKHMTWDEQIKGALSKNGAVVHSDTLVADSTPQFLEAEGISQKPLAVPLSVVTKARSGKDASHSIRDESLVKLQSGIRNATLVIDNPARNALVFVTDVVQDGKPVLVAFSKDADFDGDNVHKATSIHLQMNVETMLRALPANATVYVKNNEPNAAGGVTNNLRSLAARIKFIKDIVVPEKDVVKKNSAVSEKTNQRAAQESTGDGQADGTRRRGTVTSRGMTMARMKKGFNRAQREACEILTRIADVTGIDIVLYRSEAGVDGQLHGGVVDGIDLRNDSGAFSWHNDKVYIDVRAGLTDASQLSNVFQYTMLRTFDHEFVHFIEKHNPQGYAQLRELVFDFMRRNGKDPEQLIDAYMEQDTDLSREEASREVVAESLTDILPQTQFVQELAQKHRSLFQQLLDKLKEFVTRIKAHFAEMEMNRSEEAAAVKEHIDGALQYAQELVELFDAVAARAVENYQGAAQKNTAPIGSGVQKQQKKYDYSKPFAEQVEDYKKGHIPKTDSLIVGATPDVFKQIGFNALPMSINTTHIDYALYGLKDADHLLGEALLKQLPDIIKKPVAVFTSQTQPGTSVVALLQITVNGKQVVMPVAVDGFSRQNGIRIDSNSITSVFGKTNAVTKLLHDAMVDESNGKFALLYMDKKEAVTLLQRAGLQLPSGLKHHDGFIHSIRESRSPVKPKLQDATESQQFKRWFGDWQKHPQNASKVVNADGTPKVVYHGSKDLFTTFSYGHIGSATGVGILGDGFYFTDKKQFAKKYGENIYPVYLQMKNPYIAKESEAYKLNTSQLASQGYDGVILRAPSGDVYMVFNNTQIKSATDNIGTFDGSDPDIRHQRRRAPVTNRELLEKAEGTNGFEKEQLEKYRKRVEAAREQSRKLEQLRKELDALTENTPAARQKRKLLQDEMLKTKNRMQLHEDALQEQENKYLQAVLTREKQRFLTQMQEKYGTIPKGEKAVRDDSLPVSTDGENRVSYTARTVKGAAVTPDEFAQLLDKEVAEGGLSYLPIHNDDTTQQAIQYIQNEGWKAALAEWYSDVGKGKTGADMAARGALLLNNAARAGDRDTWREILFSYQQLGTRTAQGLQALRILKKLSPEDSIYMVRRSVNQMVKDMHLKTDVVLDKDLLKRYETAENEEQRDMLLGMIQQSVADQIPASLIEKFTALRYVNMLGNLRTQVRNFSGNAAMMITSVLKNTIAAGLENNKVSEWIIPIFIPTMIR